MESLTSDVDVLGADPALLPGLVTDPAVDGVFGSPVWVVHGHDRRRVEDRRVQDPSLKSWSVLTDWRLLLHLTNYLA